jgi:hypothetical protein
VDLCGFMWIYVDLCGFMWIYVDLCGFMWIYVDLFGFIVLIWIYFDLSFIYDFHEHYYILHCVKANYLFKPPRSPLTGYYLFAIVLFLIVYL